MGENRNWNDNFTQKSMSPKRHPLHHFSDDVFDSPETTNGIMASVENHPVKADRYGYYHGTRL